MMKVMLTGSTGMLGSGVLRAAGNTVICVPRADLNLDDFGRFEAVLRAQVPDVVINCAADVDAERAEYDPEPAIVANALLPGRIAQACRERETLLVHFSSTGIYGDWKDDPYSEEDTPHPTTVHHRAKLRGEALVRESGCRSLILRTGWLFGGSVEHTRNFFWRRLVEAAERGRLSSDTSQTGCPTFVDDVAQQTFQLIRERVQGTYNCVSQGRATRFDYVARIVAAMNLDCPVEPTGAFTRRAPVSHNESAINLALHRLNLDSMPHWTTAIDAYSQHVRHWPEMRKIYHRFNLQN